MSSRFGKLWPASELDSRQWCIASCRWPVFLERDFFFFFFLFFLFFFFFFFFPPPPLLHPWTVREFIFAFSFLFSSFFSLSLSLRIPPRVGAESALTHCQKERVLSQWLACVHEEDGGEEGTIIIEGVRGVGACSSIHSFSFFFPLFPFLPSSSPLSVTYFILFLHFSIRLPPSFVVANLFLSLFLYFFVHSPRFKGQLRGRK